MKPTVIATVLLVTATMLGAQTVQDRPQPINADRPGLADSSATVDRGAFQVEAGVERDHTGAQRDLLTPLLLRYGITQSLELRVETNGYQHSHSGDGATQSGITPISLGVKLRILDEKTDQYRPSLAIIARTFFPSGSGPFRSKRANVDLRLAADFTLSAHWSLNPNVGVAHDGEAHLTSALTALTLTYNFNPAIAVFIDGGMQTPEQRGGTSSLLLDAGTTWIVGNDTQLDVALGWRAHGITPPNLFWAAGMSRRF